MPKIYTTSGGRWFDPEYWKHAEKWERWVAEQIISLSEGEFTIKYAGFGAGKPEKIKDERSDEEMAEARFDLLIKRNGQEVAEVEVAADRKYTWTTSHHIPTRADKVSRAEMRTLPCFMVYILTLEKPPKALWLPLRDIKEIAGETDSRFVKDRTGTPIMIAKNYFVAKEKWNIGLQSLVEQLKLL